MEKQPSWTVPSQKTGQKMNLIALLFFMMGALHVYGQIQARENWWTVEAVRLVRVALFAGLVAGMIEIAVF